MKSFLLILLSACLLTACDNLKKPIENANFLKIALEYSQSVNALILSYPSNDKIDNYGIINEVIVSAKTGMKGMPYISESIQISSDMIKLKISLKKLL